MAYSSPFQSIVFLSLATTVSLSSPNLLAGLGGSKDHAPPASSSSGSSASQFPRAPAVTGHGLVVQQQLPQEEAVIDEDEEFDRLRIVVRAVVGEEPWRLIQERALQAIEQRDFTYFDPLVGDASDELRALFGAYVDQRLSSRLELSQDELDLASLIFILSHALVTEYREDGFVVSAQNEPQQLSEFLRRQGVSGNLSRNEAARLIKDLERAIAYGSVVFARRLARGLRSYTGHELSDLFLSQPVFDDPMRGRPMLSYFGRRQLLLEFARVRKGVPLVIRTRLSAFGTDGPSVGMVIAVYRYNGREFGAPYPAVLDTRMPVLVADAVTTRLTTHGDYFSRWDHFSPDNGDVEHYIEELDFETAWLSDAATHPRFANHVYVTTLHQEVQYTGRLERFARDPVMLRNAWYFPTRYAYSLFVRSTVELSIKYGLNTEEAVIRGFHERSLNVQRILGKDAWKKLKGNALQAIRQRDFTYFDPLVRETSCELRALFGIHVARRARLWQIPLLRRSLSDDEIDLATLIYILSHALVTKYGEDGFGDGDKNEGSRLLPFLTSKGVGSIVPRSRNQVEALIKELERAVAYGSVMFARRQAGELRTQTGRELQELFLDQCIFDDPDRLRPVLPCFGVCCLALEIGHKWNVPFVFRIRFGSVDAPSRGTVVAAYEYNGGEFVPLDPTNIDLDAPVLVMDAVTPRFCLEDETPPSPAIIQQYLEELNLELVKTFLLDAALHPQYAGLNRIELLTEYPENKLIAGQFYELRRRTSTENQQLLSVVHAYATTWERARRYAGRIEGEDHSGVPIDNALYYPPVAFNSLPSFPFGKDRTLSHSSDFIATHDVLLNGHQVVMDEYRVTGAGNNCGFTALGLDRASAIEGLVPQIRDNPEVAEMVREEVRAAFLRGELPQSMRVDAQVLFQQRGTHADTIDGVVAELRMRFGEQFTDIDAAYTYMRGHPDVVAEDLQHIGELITERDRIEHEINELVYTPEALVRFVEEEYVHNPGMLSYIPDQRGTLYALAHVNNIEVHIVENRDGQMQGTFDVPLRVVDPAARLVYLYHTGGIDEGTGRRTLNHFNLLAHRQPD